MIKIDPSLDPAPFLARLASVFAKMDAAYSRSAARAGFACRGCEENCCRTRFHHHTLLECLYIKEGLDALGARARDRVIRAGRRAVRETARADEKGRPPRVMCPLNADDRCILYRHRPMICRLHGIPHELRPPGRPVVAGPGCDDFTRQCREKSIRPLDRTPLYREMAVLEGEFRRAAAVQTKIKMTAAEIILAFI